MKPKFQLIILVLLVAIFLAPPSLARKKRKMVVQGGVPIPGTKIIFDANYDPRLDSLVPGYKIISVAIVNESFQIIPLNLERDKWSIKIKRKRKKVKAIHDLSLEEPKVWSRLPKGVKKLLSYPLFIPIGAKPVIDLFVPDTVDVANFTSVTAKLPAMGTTIVIKPSD